MNPDKYLISNIDGLDDSTYGLLSGPAFALTFAVFGIFGGVISDKVNRKMLAGFFCIFWSLTTLLPGLSANIYVLFVSRFLLGFFEAPFNPCAYSMISDYFHPSNRGTANAYFNSAIYIGGALGSLSTNMLSALGWQLVYVIVAIIGIAFGVLGLFLVKEPVRGFFDVKVE